MDNNTQIKPRSSNIELLRIVSMIMILSLHSFAWNRASGSDGYIHSFSFGVCLDYFRESLCVCAVNVFVLISGFFGIKWKWKSFLGFAFQVYFWSLGIYFLLLVLGKVPFSYSDMFHRFNCMIGDWWFVEAYLGLYILSPLLNAFVEKIHKRFILAWVILFVIFEVYSHWVGSSMNFSRGYNTLALCGIYLIGRLLYLYKDRILVARWKSLLSYIVIALVITVIALYMLVVQGNDWMTIQKSFIFSYSNPLVILESICLFLVFYSIKLNSKFVNYIGSSIFAVYLLHMHPNLKQHYYWYCGHLYDKPFWYHLLALVCLFVGIVICAVLIDKIRELFFSYMYPKCKSLVLKIWNIRK